MKNAVIERIINETVEDIMFQLDVSKDDAYKLLFEQVREAMINQLLNKSLEENKEIYEELSKI